MNSTSMKLAACLLVTVLSCVVSCGQAPSETENVPERDPDATRIVGVLRLPDGRPALGASLRLRGSVANDEREREFGRPDEWSRPEGTVDESGRFELVFDAPRSLQFALTASLPGHAALRWRWGELARGESVDVGTQTFSAAGSIVGRIQSRSGGSVGPGWHLEAETFVTAHGPNTSTTVVRAEASGETGVFRLDGLLAGPTKLTARHESAGSVEGPRVVVDAGEEARTLVIVDDGGRISGNRITVTTRCSPYHMFGEPVNGRVFARDEAGREVELEPMHGIRSLYAVDGLEPGDYTIVVESELHEPWHRIGVEPGAKITARLKGAASLRLAVRDAATGSTVEPYTAQLRYPEERWNPNTFDLRTPRHPARGDGVHEQLIPRPATLIVEANGYARTEVPVDGWTAGEVLDVTVDLTGGVPLSVQVLRHDDTPASGALVILHPPIAGFDALEMISRPTDDSGRVGLGASLRSAVSDDEGVATFDRVAPGAWSLHVSRGAVTSVAEVVDVGGAEGRAVVRLPEAGSLRGRFDFAPGTDSTGVHARVHALDSEPPRYRAWGGPNTSHADVDASGRFAFTDLAPGTYVVSLSVPPARQDSFDEWIPNSNEVSAPIGLVDVVAGETVDATFDVREESPGWIELDVDREGGPGGSVIARASRVGDDGDVAVELGADGRARLGPLLPGRWRIAMKPAHGDWRWTTREIVAVPSGAVLERALELAVAPGRVRVFDESTGEPAADVLVLVDEALKVYTDAAGWLSGTWAVGEHEVRATIEPFAYDPSEAPSVAFEWGPEGPVVESLTLRYPAK